MLKSELVDRLVRRFPWLTRAEAEASVRTILNAIQARLAEGERCEVRDFGVFSTHTVAPRMGRNPKTGEVVAIPPRQVVHFRPGKLLRNVSNGLRPTKSD